MYVFKLSPERALALRKQVDSTLEHIAGILGAIEAINTIDPRIGSAVEYSNWISQLRAVLCYTNGPNLLRDISETLSQELDNDR